MISSKLIQAVQPFYKNIRSTIPCSSLLARTDEISTQQKRTVIYYDRNTGQRHSEKDAVDRFYRLHWGGGIRTRAGRKNRMWKKPWYIKWYTRQHVFCTEEMCQDLEKLVAPEIKKPRYFIDDIYAPYHKRHGIPISPHDKLEVSTSYVKKLTEYH